MVDLNEGDAIAVDWHMTVFKVSVRIVCRDSSVGVECTDAMDRMISGAFQL